MSTTNIYKVHYHFEISGKKASPEYIDFISAAANDYNTLKNVLSSNNRLLGGGTLQITAVQNMPSGASTVLA